MASGQPGDGNAVRLINRLFQNGSVAAMTDGQLLERFTTRRGEPAESAFEALVSRHGPMVLRVCRGLLRDPHDVDDAFQATFLVLVRRARSIGERELLGPWLYGVALRVSKKARGLAARRNRREGGIVTDPPAEELDAAWLDLRPILHEELGRLPEKYRKPVVLCHLQGLTHAEAAQELAWPVGTVSVRLSRAKTLLRDRLSRRGLTVTASLWGVGLTVDGASAAVPIALLQTTTRAAVAFATGRSLLAGTISAGAASLTRSTLTMMSLGRLKWLAASMILGTCTTGAVLQAQSKPEPVPARRPADLKSARRPNTDPFASVTDRAVAVPPVVDRGNRFEINPVPAGYFDLPRRRRQVGVEPKTVDPGQWIQVEVLEALPGRPITGERLVRPDGTIGLGFYGDLQVEDLDRNDIKIKLLEHLRKYLDDEVLGLIVVGEDGKARIKPPIESNRVFIDDGVRPDALEVRPDTPRVQGALDINVGQTIMVEVLQALPGRPITGERLVRRDGTISLGFYGDLAVAGLNRDQIKIKVIEHLGQYLPPRLLGLEVDVPDPADPLKHIVQKVAPADSTHVFVDEAASYVATSNPKNDDLPKRVEGLESKLDQILGELREIRRERKPVAPR